MITTTRRSNKEVFDLEDKNGNSVQIKYLKHKALNRRVVTIGDAAEFLGVSAQTIYTRIKENNDTELINNLVVYKYTHPIKKEERKRYFFKFEYVMTLALSPKPTFKDLKDKISEQYYIIYELLENTVPKFIKTKDSEHSLVNMKEIDSMMSGYVISKAPELLGETLSQNKKNVIYFSLSSFSFRAQKESVFILTALKMMKREIENGHFGEKINT